MTRDEMKAVIKELKEFKALRDEITSMITSLEDQIKTEMDAQQTEEMFLDEYKITYKPFSSSRIDAAALKKAFPEIAEKYGKMTHGRRLLVS